MSWFHQTNSPTAASAAIYPKKAQFYVWYLGSKESDGLRGREHVLPAMRHLLKESTKRPPNKVTVQVGGKGLKLIQNVPTMNKSGKLKMEIMKFQIPAHSITFSMIGPAPFNDVVACIMLVFNPETKCPVHVHCYRCDSAETAVVLHANLQQLLNRKEAQRHIGELEHRLLVNGLIGPPKKSAGKRMSASEFLSTRHYDNSGPLLDFNRQRAYVPRRYIVPSDPPTTDTKTPATTEGSTSNQSSPNHRSIIEHEDAGYVGVTSSSDEELRTSAAAVTAARRRPSPHMLHRYAPPPSATAQRFVNGAPMMDTMHRSLFQELKQKLQPKERSFSTGRDMSPHLPSDDVGGVRFARDRYGERRRGSLDRSLHEAMLAAMHRHGDDTGNTSSTSGLGSSEETPKQLSPAADNDGQQRRLRHCSGPSYIAAASTLPAPIPPSVMPMKYRKHHQQQPNALSNAQPRLRMFGDTLKLHSKPGLTSKSTERRSPLFPSSSPPPISRQQRATPELTTPAAFPHRARRFRSVDNLHVETSDNNTGGLLRRTAAVSGGSQMAPHALVSLSPMAPLKTSACLTGGSRAHLLRAKKDKDRFWETRSKRASSWYSAGSMKNLLSPAYA